MSWMFKVQVVIMKETKSWMFKDPINSGLAKFWPCLIKQWKNGPKAKKIILPQMIFSLEKQQNVYVPISHFHPAKFQKNS